MLKQRIEISLNDITKLHVDAIVNAANWELQAGGGVCGAIFRAAGGKLQEECNQLAPCPVGKAVVTTGYQLPAEWIIHAVGPRYQDYSNAEEASRLLASAYLESLRLATQLGLKSIAFPSISTGIFGFPLEKACPIALRTTMDYLKSHETPWKVHFCCYSELDLAFYEKSFSAMAC